MAKIFNGLLITAILAVLIYVIVVQYDLVSGIPLPVISPSNTESNRNKYVQKVKEAMLTGEEELVINYVGSDNELEEFVTAAVDEAFTTDDLMTTSDYDYLKYKYIGVNVNMRGFGSAYVVTYKFDYLESKQQTDAVDKKTDEVLAAMDIDNQSTYSKIKMIHDYIIMNSAYDLSTNRNSAYACLVEGSSACQGYASLVYKMMTKAGIPCRIISGKGQNESHAWNIVKLNGSWYNIDCTWDDPIGQSQADYIDYDFFLKSNEDFLYHIRDAEYETPEFNQLHTMAVTSY